MITCCALDDDQYALDLLEEYCKKAPFLDLVKKCISVPEAMETLNQQPIDLLFLDIRMPEINGIQFFKSLKNPPLTVFTTAYSEYALDGFDLDALDFLVKPYTLERFLQSVNKAVKQLNLIKESLPVNNTSNFLFIKTDYKIVKVNLDEILYFEALKDYVKLHTTSKTIMTLQSIKSFEAKLEGRNFVRVHRSYIISMSKISSISRNRIIIGEKYIPISESFKVHFFALINQNS
jgi:DNA-binding LytR/AlgR family response regulator